MRLLNMRLLNWVKPLAVVGLVTAAPAYAADSTVPVVKIGDVDHIGLAVLDLDVTQRFFIETLGFSLLNRDPSYPAAFMRNDEVIITLWQVADPNNAVAFDRRQNIGLHHLALKVASFEALDQLYQRVKAVEGVRIEFAPEQLGSGPAKHMMIYEPGGIRLEFIHRPQS